MVDGTQEALPIPKDERALFPASHLLGLKDCYFVRVALVVAVGLAQLPDDPDAGVRPSTGVLAGRSAWALR